MLLFVQIDKKKKTYTVEPRYADIKGTDDFTSNGSSNLLISGYLNGYCYAILCPIIVVHACERIPCILFMERRCDLFILRR